MRELVADVRLHPSNFMLPIFIREGLSEPRPIAGLPAVVQHSETSFLGILDQAVEAGIASVMLFAVPEFRDEVGSQSCHPDGILNRAVRAARAHVGESLVLVADLCLDEFTDHGHCGVVNERGHVDNDATLAHYREMALGLAQAGVDLLGTSGMMDGQVGSIREALDEAGYHDVGILAYAAKYASSFYNPFRHAVESQLDGDRKTYQQDYRRTNEWRTEVELDLQQGADIIMVKPALAYLDILSQTAELSDRPVAAYIVSGEYAMVEAAAAAGVIDREAAISELLHAVKRAGAQIICTYWALEIAQKLSATSKGTNA